MRFIIILFALLPWLLVAQNDVIPFGKVEYIQVTNLIGGNANDGTCTLWFNQRISAYLHNNAPTESYVKEDGMFIEKIAGDSEGFPIFKDLKTRSVVYKTAIGMAKKKCVVEDKLESIRWKLSTETKKLGKYVCTKAVGDFGGRTYEAWFTTEIPVSSGPHKLAGLPGLILEASSTDGRVQFLFSTLELSQEFDYELKAPTEKVRLNGKAELAAKELELNMRAKKIMESDYPDVQMTIGTPHPDSKIERVK